MEKVKEVTGEVEEANEDVEQVTEEVEEVSVDVTEKVTEEEANSHSREKIWKRIMVRAL